MRAGSRSGRNEDRPVHNGLAPRPGVQYISKELIEKLGIRYQTYNGESRMCSNVIPRYAVSSVLVVVLAAGAFAAKAPSPRAVKNPRIDKVVDYTLPLADDYWTPDMGVSKGSLGGVDAASPNYPQSPGMKIGDTWYDQQHNGTMSRMVDVNRWTRTAVHFAWMRLPAENAGTRVYQYNFYNASPWGGYLGTSVPVSMGWAGYCGVQTTGDNRAVVGGHEKMSDLFAPQFYWDADELTAFFGYHSSRVPDSVEAYGGSVGQEVNWPKFCCEGTAPDAVLHVFAQVSEANAADPQAIYYFRKVGLDELGEWDYPPYIVDTIYDISQDICCSKTGKVALVWTGNVVPGLADPCDTNSGTAQYVQLDNNIFYQISNNQGASWNPRVNITCNVDGVAGYRPYTDLSALIASDENLHIVWSGRVWPADANRDGLITLQCRLFHWSQNMPYVRTVHNAEWDQVNCNGGAWQMNVSKMTVSECEGRFYVLFVMFNDIPHGVVDDCAMRGNDGSDVVGSANGELWLCVSSDNGLTWDHARNLTNSYSPNCDSAAGANGACQSDHWPSMNRFGRQNVAGDLWGGAVVVDPSAGTVKPYSGNYYLDVQYINDHDPGAAPKDEGSWQQADVRWFRVPCIEPVPVPLFNATPKEIAYPAWGHFATPVDTPFVIENSGNAALSYTCVVREYNGPAGWLTHTMGASGTVPSGLSNIKYGTITLNTAGKIVDDGTGATQYVRGAIIFTSNAPSSPDTIPVDFWVGDTLYKPTWDTMTTTCFALTVATNGNFGNQGRGKVNLDYWNLPDCDTVDTIPGNTDVYLSDGSPVICYTQKTTMTSPPAGKTLDTVANFSMYGDGFLSDRGFRAVTAHTPVTLVSDHYEFYSGVFTTNDSNIAFEKTWYAPASGSDCFLIQRLRVYSYDQRTHSGLSIGEAVDWDIPTDSGSDNGCGYDATRRMIWQTGYEYNQDPTECLNNDVRTGGMAYLGGWWQDYDEPEIGTAVPDTAYFFTAYSTSYNVGIVELQNNIDQAIAWFAAHPAIKPTVHAETKTIDFVGAYTADNPTLVYPTGSFKTSELYRNMRTKHTTNKYVLFTDSVTDLHMVMTFVNDFELSGRGCCINNRGNANNDAQDKCTVPDVTFLLAYFFGTPTGPAPVCPEEANANGDLKPDGSDRVTVTDVTYLLTYFFGIPTGPAPKPCP
jgi:hypothetical protein